MTFNEELTELLLKESEALEELKNITFKKADVLIEGNIKELELIVEKEERIINLMASLEIERENLLDNWGLKKDTPISDIIKSVPEGAEKLEKLKSKMIDNVKEIKEKNEFNRKLTLDSIEWIDFNVNLLSSFQTSSIYNKKDNEISQGNSIFDKKV